MRCASDFFTPDEKARIEAAVAEAEGQTSAEIVPVVATASGRYDRAEDIAGLWCAMILMGLVWWWLPRTEGGGYMWGLAWGRFELPALIAASVAGFLVGAVMATRLHGLRHLFTPRTEMREEVLGRARQAFFDNRVHRTADATGLLVYISVYERMAAVVADDGVTEKLGQPVMDGLCEQLVSGIKKGDAADALCGVIRDAGEQLGAALPRAEDDVNELPNHLVVVD